MKKTKLQVGRRIKPVNHSQEFREKNREKLKTHPAFLKNSEPGHPPTNAKGENQYTKAHGAKRINEALKLYLEDEVEEEIAIAVGLKKGATYADVLAKTQIRVAILGSLASVEFIRDATEGSVTGKHEFTGANGLALPPPCVINIKTKETK